MAKSTQRRPEPPARVTLKVLAERLGLSPSTISFVLNDSPGRSIPAATRERIWKAAEELNYQPSVIARTLRGQKMQTIGILLPELGEGYHTRVIAGVGDFLTEHEYLYFTVQHRHDAKLVETYPRLLQARGADGLLAVDTLLSHKPSLPTVAIAGHADVAGVPGVMLDHELAAQLSIEYLYRLGHRKMVFIKGQSFSTDSELRWQATQKFAERFGIAVEARRTIELTIDSTSPSITYTPMCELLRRDRDFTAVVCFNDISAMGAIRALYDSGLQVPHDVSVLGFDDIQSASFHVPSITTIRQPLHEMGRFGAEALLKSLSGEALPELLRVEPELVIRESTGYVRR